MLDQLGILWYYGSKIGTTVLVNWFIMIATTFFVCHVLDPLLIGARRIRFDREKMNIFKSEQLRSELVKGLQTAVGGLATILAVEFAEQTGYMKLKQGQSMKQVALEFLIYFCLFDFYYYFLHRFFLHSSLGWWIHGKHHASIVSYPSTGFSFHVIEGIITGGFNPLLGALLSFDRRTLFVVQLYGLVNTVYVHLGYEIVPLWWNKWWPTKWYLSSQFHDVHHMKINCNFGGFTTIYDRMLGTVHRNFDVMVDDLAAKQKLL